MAIMAEQEGATGGCPLCAGPVSERFDEKTARRYRWCRRCDLVSVHPDDRVTRSSEIGRYLEHDNGHHQSGYVRMLSRFLDRAVKPWCGSGASLLDYGCGYSPVLSSIARGRGYSVRSWDPYFLPDNSALQASYDVIVACEVIEHIAEPGRALAAMRELLEPGGILAVRSSLHPDSWEAFFRFWYIRDRTHVSYFSEQTVRFAAEHFGFTVVELDDPVWVLRKLPG